MTMITHIRTTFRLLLGALPCFPSVTVFASFIPEKILSSFHSIGCNKPVAVSCIHSQWRRNGISAHLQKRIPHPGHTSLLGPEHLPPVVRRALHRHLLCSGNHLWSQSEDLLSNEGREGSLRVQKAKQRSALWGVCRVKNDSCRQPLLVTLSHRMNAVRVSKNSSLVSVSVKISHGMTCGEPFNLDRLLQAGTAHMITAGHK